MGMILKLVLFLLAVMAVAGIVDCFGWYDVPYICVKSQAACADVVSDAVDAVS